MRNFLSYFLTVLIWGTTWFAIKLQIGHAPDEISIFYRTALASIFLIAWCQIKGYSLKFKAKDHVFLCCLGLSMFSVHLLFVYGATSYIVSGIISAVFSGVSFLSVLNNFIFFKAKPKVNVILGALIGIAGLFLFFWNDLTQVTLKDDTLKGLLLSGIGAFIFSLGSCITKRNTQNGIHVIPSMAMGMVYGTLAILIYILTQSSLFIFPKSPLYWMSLLYLVIPGSIIAFLCYLNLIKNIGPELAGYTTVLFPIVALLISWAFEDYTCTSFHLFGVFLVVAGNILVVMKKKVVSSH